MIRSLSDLLNEFAKEEAAKLAAYDIRHGPTIGDMYEGLSAKIISRATPPGLDLRVVSGFITDGAGWISGQMDCMLVKGQGESIPHTMAFKWPIWDVLAVFEVKKTLYGGDLRDAFVHLRDVNGAFGKWLHSANRRDMKFDISRALSSFSKITGVHPPSYKEYEATLENDLALIYYTLVLEQLAPVRIVLGFEGFKTEEGMRASLVDFLKEQGGGTGFGVPSFPQLITCNGLSLCKANGQPYWSPLRNGMWHFLASSAVNPLWLMLELIWTKIENVCGISLPWEDDLIEEVFHPLIAARSVEGKGWYLEYTKLSELSKDPTIREWRPAEITLTQQVILNRLLSDGTINIRDPHLLEFLKGEGMTIDALISSFQGMGFVALDGELLRPAIQQCVFLNTPDGHIFAGEHMGRLANYVHARAQAKKTS